MVRVFTKADGLDPMDLLHSSYDHHRAANVLFQGSPSHFDSAGYLEHMSVELLLKAWLLQVANSFVGHHRLCDLYAELVTKHRAPELTSQGQAVMTLLDEYEQLRYPNRNNPVEVGTEQQPLINMLVDLLREQLPGDMLEALKSVNPLEKGGRVLMKKKIARKVSRKKRAKSTRKR
jgi:HEPN domain